MKIAILAFGKVADIIGDRQTWANEISDTDGLRKELEIRFPALTAMSYVISVNREIITGNTAVDQYMEIALLPPFSGG